MKSAAGRRPADSRAALIRASRSAPGVPTWLTSSGSATKSWMVCFGSSDSYGSWKMNWT